MATQLPAGTKHCCKCGKDVTHLGRMKDTSGKYWCIDCGKADETQRALHAGGVCKGCGEPFSKAQLTSIGGQPYCDRCIKQKFAVKQSFMSKLWSTLKGE